MTRCERCGATGREVNYSLAHHAWLCLSCYQVPAPFERRIFLVVGPVPSTLAQICERLGRTSKDGSVRKALKKLTGEGRLTRQPDGRFVGPAHRRLDLP